VLGDWDSVIQDIAARLQRWVETPGGPAS
jgi:hypothetical protein